MKTEETRKKIMFELQAQFQETGSSSVSSHAPDDPVVSFPSPTFEKPKMFMPKDSGRLEMTADFNIHGIGFADEKNNVKSKDIENIEIYNMQDLIATNPVNMKTITYDENAVRAQLGLVKRKDWQDILFEDVDWFKKIDLKASFKKLLGR